MRAWATLVFVAALAPSVAVAQAWTGDFETGDLSQFSTLNRTIGGNDYITVASDVVLGGTHAGRIALHDDAVWPNGLKRVELHHSPATGRTAEGASLYFAWSFYLPETLPTDPSQTIGYWESDTSYHQIMAFTVSGEDLTFYTQLPSYHEQWVGTGVVTAGEWHRIAMHVVWSQGAAGRVEVWVDGTQVVTDLQVPTLPDGNEAFTQFGLLRGAIEFTDVPVIYVDDAIEGDSLAEVRYDERPMATVDGGTDAATAVDAAASTDASVSADAARVDGGARADAGSPTAITGGCGCTAGAPAGRPLALALAIVVVVSARARRSRARRPY